jgi:hypothetical protein
MGILSGAVSLTRFSVPILRDEPDFESQRFVEIAASSDATETFGFLPAEPEAEYQAGTARFFFRVRFDKRRPDSVAVDERLRELIRVEIEHGGAEFVGSRKRKKLKQQAEEELIVGIKPRSKIIEGVIDGDTLFVGSTSKAYLGRIIELLRKVGVAAEIKTPWLEHGDPEIESEILEPREPGESILGARFLRALVGDPEIMIEPESGAVRLKTIDARITLAGAVLPELQQYIAEDAEVLSAKLVTLIGPFRLDGMSFRVAGLRFETERQEHWTEQLDARLEKIRALFDLLDGRYADLRAELTGAKK